MDLYAHTVYTYFNLQTYTIRYIITRNRCRAGYFRVIPEIVYHKPATIWKFHMDTQNDALETIFF